MLFLLKSVGSINKVVENIRSLKYTHYAATELTNYSIETSPFFRSLFILNYKSDNVKLTVHKPTGSQGTPFNMTSPAKFADFINAEFVAEIPQGSSIAFTTMGYRTDLCSGPIEVITDKAFERTFKIKESELSTQGYEKCILHAPAGTGVQYQVTETDLGGAVLSIFDDRDSSLPLDSFYDQYETCWSTTSDRPLLYRLKLDSKEGKEEHSVRLQSRIYNEPLNGAIIYDGEAESIGANLLVSIRHMVIFPILGCAPCLVLIIALIFACIILKRKTPPHEKQTEANVQLP